MAVSVLGKRSQRVFDQDDCIDNSPARKRTSRRGVPQIYEDQENHSKALNEAVTVQKPQDAKLRNTPHRIGRNALVPSTNDRIHVFQDENIPPSVDATPTTKRFKDVIGFTTPATPKRRVRLTRTPLTPRTPKHSTSKSRPQSVFAAARHLFTHSNNPNRLIGRNTEREQITDFITTAVAVKAGGCMYVSGAPGTGKSALVHEVIQQFESRTDVAISTINCISLRSSAEVYGKLLGDFAPGTAAGKINTKLLLSKLFLNKTSSTSHLVLLDEIDNLLDTDCEVLYNLFEWTMHQASSVILVGIANALDLTDRFLPRLRARGLRPILLPFLPYNATQISNIITEKLRSLLPAGCAVDSTFVPFMQPAAVQLCGKKIASQTGDLRKAFSLVRRVLDQVEKETMAKAMVCSNSKQPLGEIFNPAAPHTPASTPSKVGDVDVNHTYDIQSAPRASIAHVARIASSIFNCGSVSRLAGLNLQQKAVLCSLVGGEKRKEERDPYITPSKSSSRVPTIKDLFTKYSALCRRDEGILQPLKDTEFRDVIASLETLGLVHEFRGRTTSLLTPTSSGSRGGRSHDDKQVISAVSEQEVRDSLDGAGSDLLRRLLDTA